MAGDREQIAAFVRQAMGIREVLQIVEHALVDGGYDDFVMATERGSFHWRTFERACAETPELPGDALEH